MIFTTVMMVTLRSAHSMTGWHVNEHGSVSALVNSQSARGEVPEGEVKSRWAPTLGSFCSLFKTCVTSFSPRRMNDARRRRGGRRQWLVRPAGLVRSKQTEGSSVQSVWHLISHKKTETSPWTDYFRVSWQREGNCSSTIFAGGSAEVHEANTHRLMRLLAGQYSHWTLLTVLI